VTVSPFSVLSIVAILIMLPCRRSRSPASDLRQMVGVPASQ
jgi:hypothetical protein